METTSLVSQLLLTIIIIFSSWLVCFFQLSTWEYTVAAILVVVCECDEDGVEVTRPSFSISFVVDDWCVSPPPLLCPLVYSFLPVVLVFLESSCLSVSISSFPCQSPSKILVSSPCFSFLVKHARISFVSFTHILCVQEWEELHFTRKGPSSSTSFAR